MKDELFEKKPDLSFVSVSGAGLRASLKNRGFCRLARGGCSPLSSLKAWTRQRKSSPGIRCPVGPLCISHCMGGTS